MDIEVSEFGAVYPASEGGYSQFADDVTVEAASIQGSFNSTPSILQVGMVAETDIQIHRLAELWWKTHLKFIENGSFTAVDRVDRVNLWRNRFDSFFRKLFTETLGQYKGMPAWPWEGVVEDIPEPTVIGIDEPENGDVVTVDPAADTVTVSTSPKTIVAWIKNNPLKAGALAIGGFLVLKSVL